jgi:hypothetical protein
MATTRDVGDDGSFPLGTSKRSGSGSEAAAVDACSRGRAAMEIRVKYYTKEIWSNLQERGAVGAEAARRGDEAFAAYARELATLRDRVPADVFAFFKDADVHDGALMQLRLTEFDPLAPRVELPEPEGDDNYPPRYPLRVELSVAEGGSTLEWTLHYFRIRRLLVDFPTDSPLFFDIGNGFEDWGYHELTDAGDGCLRHEVLFSSGSVLLIEFQDISVTRFDRSAS